MASKDNIKLFFGAGLALAVGVAFADTTPVVSQTFEGAASGEIGGSLSGWAGNGTVETVDGTITIGNSVDRPITDTGTKVLAIAGEVTCTSSGTEGGYYVSDFLVKIPEGNDGKLANPPTDDGVQIAVAAGQATTVGNATTIPLCVYSKDKSNSAGWTTSSIAIDTNTWHRLTLVFDYGNKTCQINWDGAPVVTEKGYLKSDKNGTGNGSWYKLANDNSTSIASLKFVGAASIDDVLVTQGTKTDVTPAYGDAAAAVALDDANVSIPLNKLSEWGVDSTTIETATIDNSGMTVAEKLAAGLEPGENTKFELTGMTLAANGTPTITFPGSATAKNGVQPSYTVTVTDGSGTVVSGASATIGAATGGGMQAAITLPDNPPAVLKFKITATATTPTPAPAN